MKPIARERVLLLATPWTVTGIGSEGPFGGSAGVGVWRSFLTEEYAKSFAKAGGIGLADHVYRTLIAQQEARAN